MQPTSKFGELFQYSNLMAAAAGYTAAHVVYPPMELGAGYDRGMQSYVFDPLQMRATTFKFATALAGNHATEHAPDIDGKPAKALMAVKYAVIPVRPRGRRLEQRTWYGEVRFHGTRRRQASRRQNLHFERTAARAP
jgi:CubicO group peptidase (beta-lactamase class C family)